MIEFLTLFLGLVAGIHSVEFTVADPVHAVEIRLDDERVAFLDGPPWTTGIDLGQDLRPHRLTAIALDASGEEIGRTEQRVNLPRSSVELRALLERDAAGQPVGVRLSWESLFGADPSQIAGQIDGRPLEFDSQGRAMLPKLDMRRLHFLSVEVEFPGQQRAKSEFSFGGSYGSEIQSELSAVALSLPKSLKKPKVDDVRRWIRNRGQPVGVVAVEQGPAAVVVVRDQSADALIERLRVEGQRVLVPVSRGRMRSVQTRIDPENMRFSMKLGEDDRVRFLWPSVEKIDHPRYDVELFQTSMAFTGEHGGMHWLLTRVPAPWWEEGRPATVPPAQRLADAVAVAGLRAAASRQRRAVVLVLGSAPRDVGFYRPEAVRSYLRALGVPLIVWAEDGVASQRDRAQRGDDAKNPSPTPAWGEIQPINTEKQLGRAVRDLRRNLGSQWVIWLDGEYLPHELTLNAPPGVEFVR